MNVNTLAKLMAGGMACLTMCLLKQQHEIKKMKEDYEKDQAYELCYINKIKEQLEKEMKHKKH